MVEVRKRDGESAESLIRRFTKRLQQSGKLLRVKKGRYFQPPKNKRQVKDEALRRKILRETKDYLKKIGRLDDIRDQKKIGQILKLTLKQKEKERK
ncbi:MAG: 30S ribosomal protein S21 [Patescibacteria group bacterium]